MKGFVLFLVVVLLAYTYAAPQYNYGNVSAGTGSVATGVVSNSTIGSGSYTEPGGKGNGSFSPGDAKRKLLEELAQLEGIDVKTLQKKLWQ